jgi:hypothetical protein
MKWNFVIMCTQIVPKKPLKNGVVAILFCFYGPLVLSNYGGLFVISPYIQTIDDGGVFVVILYLDNRYFLKMKTSQIHGWSWEEHSFKT